MIKRNVAIKRKDISELRSKKARPFNAEKFVKMAKDLRKAVKKEEKKYGPVLPCS